MTKRATQRNMWAVVTILIAGNVHAWTPNAADLGAAVNKGDFTEYGSNLSSWLSQKVPADASKVSEAAMRSLLKEPDFVLALDQRQFIGKAGADKLGAFAKASEANQAFLTGFLGSAEVMDLFLEGGVPREKDYTGALGVLRTIMSADPDAREGLYLMLAIATSLAHSTPSNSFDGKPIDPLKRYQHFKAAHQGKELDPMFDNLSVWEFEKVVGSWGSDEDLAWGREMLMTMRPELVIEKRYVRQVSEVQYTKPDWGNPPHRFANVLGGGGKCGPRAWFGRFINQAFGVPVWGVKQPGHAAVGFLGNEGWKVMFGRGWDKSTWDGMNGNQFVALATAREYRLDFSQAEHLRWLADSLANKEQADAILSIAEQIQKNPTGPRTANRLDGNRPFKPTPEPAYQPVAGVQRLHAYNFTESKDAHVCDSFVGGKQVNFAKNRGGWIEFKVDIPKPGKYGLKTYHACSNGRCRLRIYIGDKSPGWMHLRNTTGLWGDSGREWEFQLPATDTIRFAFPDNQRGVSVKWFELRAIDETN